MPAVINEYAIVVDLHRLNVQTSNIIPLEGPPPVDLVNLTYPVAKPEYTAGEFSLEKVTSNDPAYHLRYNIYTRGHLLGFILTDRTKKYGYNQKLRSLHLANEAFYTLDYGRALAEFLRVFALEVANNSQIDISLSTQQIDPAKLVGYYTSKPDKYQRIKRKNDKKPNVYGEKDEATGKVLFTSYWGENSDTVTVKVYNKTAKLSKEPKQYILDWYAANGFDPAKPVYNLEVSIKARALKEYRGFAVTEDGEEISMYKARNNNVVSKASKQTEITSYDIDIEKLNSPAYLSQLFQHFFPIDIRKKDASRPTNCSRISLIDFTIYGESTLNKTVAIRATAPTLTKSKNMLKNLVTFYAETGLQSALDTARAIAEREQLTDALNKMLARISHAPAPTNAPANAQQIAA